MNVKGRAHSFVHLLSRDGIPFLSPPAEPNAQLQTRGRPESCSAWHFGQQRHAGGPIFRLAGKNRNARARAASFYFPRPAWLDDGRAIFFSFLFYLLTCKPQREHHVQVCEQRRAAITASVVWEFDARIWFMVIAKDQWNNFDR